MRFDDSQPWLAWMLPATLATALAGCELVDGLFGDDRAQADAPAPSHAPDPAGDEPAAKRSGQPAGIAPPGPMQGVYKFVDDQGVVHFVDSLAKVPVRYRKKAHHPEGGSYTIVEATPIDELIEKNKIDTRRYRSKDKPPSKVQGRSHDQVFLYTTSWCGYCTRARNFLKGRGVAFIEKDVERDRAALEEMLTKSGGGRGVPVIDVYGTIMRGFNPVLVARALGR